MPAVATSDGPVAVTGSLGYVGSQVPQIDVGGAPPEMEAYIEKHNRVYDAPRARCDRAREELGLETHAIEDTLLETGQTLIDLGLVEPSLK